MTISKSDNRWPKTVTCIRPDINSLFDGNASLAEANKIVGTKIGSPTAGAKKCQAVFCYLLSDLLEVFYAINIIKLPIFYRFTAITDTMTATAAISCLAPNRLGEN